MQQAENGLSTAPQAVSALKEDVNFTRRRLFGAAVPLAVGAVAVVALPAAAAAPTRTVADIQRDVREGWPEKTWVDPVDIHDVEIWDVVEIAMQKIRYAEKLVALYQKAVFA